MVQYTSMAKPRLRSEDKYQTLFEHSGDAIYVARQDGKFTHVNQSAADLLGYTIEGLLKLNVSDICADPTAWDSLKRLAEEELYARDDSIRLKKDDGTEIECMLTATVRTGFDGRVLGYQGIIHDMVGQEQKRIALQQSEERFRQLSDASSEGIHIHENGVNLFCNRAYARMLGCEPEEIIGKPVLQTVAPEYRDYVTERMESAYQGFDRVLSIRRDGAEFPAEVSTRVTYYKGRKVLATVVRDMTERTHMEDELRESEEKLRIMFESITEGVIVYDLDGRILQLNDATVHLYGFQCKEELIGQNVLHLIAKKDRARAKSNMKIRLQNAPLRNMEYVCLRKEGTEFSADWSIGLMKDKAGNPVGHVAVLRDITERKRAELNTQFYVSEITKAHEEERQRLACELHDETVQSLIALSLDIEAIKKAKARLPVETVRQLESLQGKASEIVHEVRRFSHKLRPCTLDKLGLVPALELLVSRLKEKRANSRFEISGWERRLAPEVEVMLFRIAQEALRNVWKHSQATESIVKVDFAPHNVRLIIKDNGRGFDLSEEQSELANKGKLGLISMKERASLVGGTFSIESQLGKGTTVTVDVQA